MSESQGCTLVVWLPVWLPNGRKGAGIRTLSCALSRTRTYGLLLRRQSRSVARQRRTWPDVPLGRPGNGWMWPDGALDLRLLAPSLAPRDFVSNANVQMLRPSDGYRIASPTLSFPNRARPQGIPARRHAHDSRAPAGNHVVLDPQAGGCGRAFPCPGAPDHGRRDLDELDAALGELRSAGWPAPEDAGEDDNAELDGRSPGVSQAFWADARRAGVLRSRAGGPVTLMPIPPEPPAPARQARDGDEGVLPNG